MMAFMMTVLTNAGYRVFSCRFNPAVVSVLCTLKLPPQSPAPISWWHQHAKIPEFMDDNASAYWCDTVTVHFAGRLLQTGLIMARPNSRAQPAPPAPPEFARLTGKEAKRGSVHD
jgi:hypothetical protein